MNVIFFNPNQAILFKRFQAELCKNLIQKEIKCAPVFPLVIECAELELNSKITEIKISGLESSRKSRTDLALIFDIYIEEKMCKGKLKLLKFLKNEQIEQNEDKTAFSDFFSERLAEFKSSIKKISPFKICEMQLERTENYSTWKILKEKWVKL
ncbi:MAG: hypothetical protein KBT11_09625 [Treponema sp.]|nr:hypothetical protein [Candidatus Treponema equifaecale]